MVINTRKEVLKEAAMRILMYYDGTEESKEAISVAKLHGKAFNATVEVVSSLPRGTEQQLDHINEMENELEYVKTVFDNENIPCETHLLIRGLEAGEDVVRFAAEKNVDEIIIGTEKRTRVEKFLLGSVAQHVIYNSNRPVVIV